MNLPGWRVPGVNPRLERNGYHLRENADCCYVIYGANEIVAVIPASMATVKLIELAVQDDIDRKMIASVSLGRQLGLTEDAS